MKVWYQLKGNVEPEFMNLILQSNNVTPVHVFHFNMSITTT